MLPILIRLDDRNVYATHNRVSSIPLFFSFSPRPMTFFENLPESSFRFNPIDIRAELSEEEPCTDFEYESDAKRFILQTYEYDIRTKMIIHRYE